MNDRAEQYEQLTAYIDGELSDTECAEVERLLEEDAEAREVLDTLRETSRIVASLPRETSPSDLVGSVTARLERGVLLGDEPAEGPFTHDRSRWAGWRWGAAVAATVAVMCTAGWFAWTQHTVSEPAVVTVAALEKGSGREAAQVTSGGEKPVMGNSYSAAPMSRGLPPNGARTLGRIETEQDKQIVEAPSPSPEQDPPRRFAKEFAKKGAEEPDGALADRLAVASLPESAKPSIAGLTSETVPELNDDVSGNLSSASSDEFPEQGFGQLLAENVLTNLDVQTVPFNTISNQVLVTTDAETNARLISHINGYLAANEVQNLGEKPLPEPIEPTRAFYAFEKRSAEGERSVGGAASTAEWRMNLQAPQARELIRTMNDIAQTDGSAVTWSFNGAEIAGVDPAPEVVNQLAMNSLPVGGSPDSQGLLVLNDRLTDTDGAMPGDTIQNASRDSLGEGIASSAEAHGEEIAEGAISSDDLDEAKLDRDADKRYPRREKGEAVSGEKEQDDADKASETEPEARKGRAMVRRGNTRGARAQGTSWQSRGKGGRLAGGDTTGMSKDRDPTVTQPASGSTRLGGSRGAFGVIDGRRSMSVDRFGRGFTLEESDTDVWVVLAVSLRLSPSLTSSMEITQPTSHPTSRPAQRPTSDAKSQGAAGG